MKNLAINKLFDTNPIRGSFCELHHITLDDAELIYDLRTNRKDNFLKPTSGGVEEQRQYLQSYFERLKNREEIYYKIFDLKNQKFSGILRLTQIKDEKAFNWQSFVVSETTSPNTPLDAMLMVYRIGFEFLEKESCGPWIVDKKFSKMIKIHDFIKMAKAVGEEGEYYWFAVQRSDYENNINRFLKMSYAKLGGLI